MAHRETPIGYVGRRIEITEEANRVLNDVCAVTGIEERDVLSRAILYFATSEKNVIVNAIKEDAEMRTKAFLASLKEG